jgi:hypothetical protein
MSWFGRILLGEALGKRYTKPSPERLAELWRRSATLRARSDEAQKRAREQRDAAARLIRETRQLLGLEAGDASLGADE